MAPGCSFVPIEQGYHELLFETREIRQKVWQYMAAHLKESDS
jgi:alpha-beta hydrolase superfamily lysophospholipase